MEEIQPTAETEINRDEEPAAPAADTAGAPQKQPDEVKKANGKLKNAAKSYFTATRMAYLGLFCALSYVMYLPVFEFPLFPAVPFMKVDFSNVFVMIAAFALDPVSGVVTCVIKELLHALTFSQTIGVGELANILIALPYILLPSIIYIKKKGIKTVLITLSAACVLQAAWSIPVNYTLTFPFFFTAFGMGGWTDGMAFYLTVWYWAVLFNLIKSVLVTAATLLLYKSVSRLIKYTNKKLSSHKHKKSEAAAENAEKSNR